MSPETKAKLAAEKIKQLTAYAESLESRAARVRAEIQALLDIPP